MWPEKPSVAYQVAAGYLLLLVFLFWVWTLEPVVASLLPNGALITRRILYVQIGVLIVTAGVAAYFRTWSLIWQLPMQGLTMALFVAGVTPIVSLLFYTPRDLVDSKVLPYVGLVAGGAATMLLMKRMQVRFLGGYHRHLTTRSSGR